MSVALELRMISTLVVKGLNSEFENEFGPVTGAPPSQLELGMHADNSFS